MKICSSCKVEKPLSCFYKDTKKYTSCKSCKNEKSKAWAASHPERIQEQRRKTRLKTLYGMSPEDYATMFKKQNGCCALCGEPEKDKHLAVDHCHITGKVRELLCTNCNTILGKAHDDSSLLLRMSEYLNYHWYKEN